MPWSHFVRQDNGLNARRGCLDPSKKAGSEKMLENERQAGIRRRKFSQDAPAALSLRLKTAMKLRSCQKNKDLEALVPSSRA